MNEEFGNLKEGILLGKGTYGKVLKLTSSVDSKYYAIKIIEDKLGKIDFKEVEIT